MMSPAALNEYRLYVDGTGQPGLYAAKSEAGAIKLFRQKPEHRSIERERITADEKTEEDVVVKAEGVQVVVSYNKRGGGTISAEAPTQKGMTRAMRLEKAVREHPGFSTDRGEPHDWTAYFTSGLSDQTPTDVKAILTAKRKGGRLSFPVKVADHTKRAFKRYRVKFRSTKAAERAYEHLAAGSLDAAGVERDGTTVTFETRETLVKGPVHGGTWTKIPARAEKTAKARRKK
jgi:hypothetical protein